MSDDEIKARARKLFRPPFRFEGGYIWDADTEMVADNRGPDGSTLRVRGWGRLTHIAKSEDEACALQDAYGELLAEALTKFWNERTPRPDSFCSACGAHRYSTPCLTCESDAPIQRDPADE